jgi:hypothetical protein
MFTPDITIGTNVYSLTSQRTNSSLRSDPSTGLDNPNLMTISHEVAKNGKVSSVVILDSEVVVPCTDTCTITPASDTIRLQLKVQYNPLIGRTDTATEIERLRVLLVTFASNATSFAKFLNKES